MAQFYDPNTAGTGLVQGDLPDIGDRTDGLLADVTGMPSSQITPDVAARAGEMNFRDAPGVPGEVGGFNPPQDPTDFVHKVSAQLHDLARVKSNVADMVRQGAPEAEIDSYIKLEGTTVDAIKALDQKSIGKYIDDIGRTLANGMTFGFADKIAAGLDTLTKGGTYEENLKNQREQTAAVPLGIKIPGEIAGAVASSVAAAPVTGGLAAASGVAKLPGIVRAAGAGAGAGALGAAGTSDNVTPSEIAKGAGLGATIGGVLGIGGKILGALGDKITTSVIRPTQRDIADGFSLDTIKQFNLGGSLNTTYNKTQTLLSDLSDKLRSKLSNSSETIDLSRIIEQTRAELSSAIGKLKGFGANQKINAALDGLANEADIVGNKLSIPDAQIIKQAAGSFGAWQYGRPDPESKASEIVFNVFYNKLKTAIENASPSGVKEINQQISKLIPVNNALIRRIPVADRNYALSLGDLVALAASTAHPSGLVLTGMNLAQKSGAVGNALSKASAISGAAIPASGLGGMISQSIPLGGTDQAGNPLPPTATFYQRQ